MIKFSTLSSEMYVKTQVKAYLNCFYRIRYDNITSSVSAWSVIFFTFYSAPSNQEVSSYSGHLVIYMQGLLRTVMILLCMVGKHCQVEVYYTVCMWQSTNFLTRRDLWSDFSVTSMRKLGVCLNDILCKITDVPRWNSASVMLVRSILTISVFHYWKCLAVSGLGCKQVRL